MPSKVIIVVIEFMFLGINIFWALLRAHFNPRLTACAKMSLSQLKTYYASEHKFYCFIHVINYRHLARFYALKICYTVVFNFICSMFWHLSVINVPHGNTQLNIYKDHQYPKNVKAKALYIWNQRLFMPMSDALGGQTFLDFRNIYLKQQLYKRHFCILYNLRIKLAVNFPSPNQALLRLLSCMFFFF